jgi:hypothetical protein
MEDLAMLANMIVEVSVLRRGWKRSLGDREVAEEGLE